MIDTNQNFQDPRLQDPIPNKVLNFENFKNFEYLLKLGFGNWNLNNMCPMVKLHHHPQLTKHPVVKSTKFTESADFIFLAVILVIILGIFSIVYSFKKLIR